MFVCIYNTKLKKIDHAKEIKESEMELEWPMYELECMNRGGAWLPYKGKKQYILPEDKEEELYNEK